MENPPPRTYQQRKQDTLHRLEHDVDLWVGTADPERGLPYLVPLSFLWDGSTVLLSTPAASPTGRNLTATGTVRLGLGLTRDVVLIEGALEAIIAPADLPADVGDAFAAKTGFDPRDYGDAYRYYRIRPTTLQAWREVDELRDRTLLRKGEWTGSD